MTCWKINDLLLSKVTTMKLKLQNGKYKFHCVVFHRGITFQKGHFVIIRDMWFVTGGLSPVTRKLRGAEWPQNIKHAFLLFYSKCG
jgi:hypothetical protein